MKIEERLNSGDIRNNITAVLMIYSNWRDATKCLTFKEKIRIFQICRSDIKLMSTTSYIIMACLILISGIISKHIGGGYIDFLCNTIKIFFAYTICVLTVLAFFKYHQFINLSVKKFHQYMEFLADERRIQTQNNRDSAFNKHIKGVIYEIYTDHLHPIILASRTSSKEATDLPRRFMCNGYSISLFNIHVFNTANRYLRFEDGTIHGDSISETFQSPTKMTYHELVAVTYSLSSTRLEGLIFAREYSFQDREVFDIFIKNRKFIENMFFIRAVEAATY